MYKNVLEDSGLKPGEAEIYDILLQFGDSPASQLTSKTKLKRGMIYKFLDDLKQRGLVSSYSKNKKTYFKPEHPYKILESIEKTIQESKTQETMLQSTLPQIVNTFNTLQNKPGVRVYEGVEGIKEVYMDTLRDGNEILSIVQVEDIHPKIRKWLDEFYVKERTRLNINARVIVAESKKAKNYVTKSIKENRNVRRVPKGEFPIAVEMNIYGDKVSFMNFVRGVSQIGIIINNKMIADTQRALFILAWEKTSDFENSGN